MSRQSLVAVTRMLGRERLGRLKLQYGWAACGSLCLILLPAAWPVSVVLSRLIAEASATQVEARLSRCWAAWVVAGVLAGRDLTWHPRIERLIRFPLPFALLYGAGLLLGLLTFPLFLLFYVLEVCAWNAAPFSSSCLLVPAGFALLALSVRLSVSIVRTAMQRRSPLDRWARIIARVLSALIGATAAASLWGAPYLLLSPGCQFARLMLERDARQAFLLMLLQTGILLLADHALQFELTYCGIAGPQASPISHRALEWRLPLHRSPRTVLWRMSMRGWIGNRNVLLLFLWGAGYGFAYTYLSRPQSRDYFFMFCFMVLFFHSYLRGNVLGTDHGAAWMYLMFPVPISRVFRTKYSALTALQLVMVGAVLLPALLRRPPGMASASDWAMVLSYVASSLLLTEVFGSIFSISHPEAIERTFSYSGGMTLGAIVVGAAHTLLLVPYLLCIAPAGPLASPARSLIAAAAIPASLWVLRSRAMSYWIRHAVLKDPEKLLCKLGI